MVKNNSFVHPFTQEKKTFSSKSLLRLTHIILISIEIGTLFYGNIPVSLQLMIIVLSCIILGSYGSLIDPDDVEAGVMLFIFFLFFIYYFLFII